MKRPRKMLEMWYDVLPYQRSSIRCRISRMHEADSKPRLDVRIADMNLFDRGEDRLRKQVPARAVEKDPSRSEWECLLSQYCST